MSSFLGSLLKNEKGWIYSSRSIGVVDWVVSIPSSPPLCKLAKASDSVAFAGEPAGVVSRDSLPGVD